MNQSEIEKARRAEGVIKETHARGQDVFPGPVWHSRVMMHIRSLDAFNEGTAAGNDALMQRLALRFAAATCMLAAVLFVFAFKNGINPEFIIGQMFFSDPIEVFTLQSFIPW